MRAAGFSEQLKAPGFWAVDPCELRFEDPLPSIVETMHDLGVWVSAIAATELNITQQVAFSGAETATQSLGGALFPRSCSVLGIIANLLQLASLIHIWWGVWRLDRQRTMSPGVIVEMFCAEGGGGPSMVTLAWWRLSWNLRVTPREMQRSSREEVAVGGSHVLCRSMYVLFSGVYNLLCEVMYTLVIFFWLEASVHNRLRAMHYRFFWAPLHPVSS